MGPDDLGIATWLASPDGHRAVITAAEVRNAHPSDPAAAARAFQRLAPSLTSGQRAVALSQAELRQTAADRYAIDASSLLLTRDGLEQATRPEVSRARLRMMDLPAGSAVVDGTAGLGFDTRAFIEAGMQVTAVERDPATAALLRVNAAEARVIVASITDPKVLDPLVAGLGPTGVLFLDPARRDGRRSADGRRAHPERDPQRWSPPWSFVLQAAQRIRVAVKVAPGFSPDHVPLGWCAAWIGTRQGPAEACLLNWAALPAARRACVVDGEFVDHVDEDERGLASNAIDVQWLHEPAQVVVHAELVDALARRCEVGRLAPDSHWLASGSPVDPSRSGHLLASFRVLDRLPGNPKGMRAALRDHGIENATIKSRGSRIDARQWRERLRLPEGPSATLAILESSGVVQAYLVERQV